MAGPTISVTDAAKQLRISSGMLRMLDAKDGKEDGTIQLASLERSLKGTRFFKLPLDVKYSKTTLRVTDGGTHDPVRRQYAYFYDRNGDGNFSDKDIVLYASRKKDGRDGYDVSFIDVKKYKRRAERRCRDSDYNKEVFDVQALRLVEQGGPCTFHPHNPDARAHSCVPLGMSHIASDISSYSRLYAADKYFDEKKSFDCSIGRLISKGEFFDYYELGGIHSFASLAFILGPFPRRVSAWGGISKYDVEAREIDALKDAIRVGNVHGIAKGLNHGWRTSTAATRALKKMGAKALPVMYERFYGGANRYDRRNALTFIRKHAPGVTAPFVDALNDGDHRVRAIGIIALAERDGSFADEIIHKLGDKSPYVRKAAIVGLKRIGGDAFSSHYLGAVHDRDYLVREAAFKALPRNMRAQEIKRLKALAASVASKITLRKKTTYAAEKAELDAEKKKLARIKARISEFKTK